jgi:nitrogen regulatory protein PII 2
MKEIFAIIRPGKWLATKTKLLEMGITSFTTRRVHGRGRQKGLRYLNRQGGTTGIGMIPKRAVWLWVNDEPLRAVVEAIIAVNRTAAIGDGKIFICPAEDAVRLRTGDRGELAVF